MPIPAVAVAGAAFFWRGDRGDHRFAVGPGCGVASGAGPAAGLYGAIFTGFFAAQFGGTPSQITGPTGPMTVVMAVALTRFAAHPAVAFTVAMIAGLLQILFGRLGAGQFVTYISLQGHRRLHERHRGFDYAASARPAKRPPWAQGIAQALIKLPSQWSSPNGEALTIAMLASATVWFWPRSFGRWLLALFAALLVSTLLAAFWLRHAPVLGAMPRGLPLPHLPVFNWSELPGMLQGALSLALLDSIDSLLTSPVADKLARCHHDSKLELIGQGIGDFSPNCSAAFPTPAPRCVP